MRFRLTFELTDPKERILPLNYQYELSSWIYHALNSADPAFATWLHDKGYTDDRKQFKLFTFSNLVIPQRRIQADRLEIRSRDISMLISMLPDEMVSHFIRSVPGSVFHLGRPFDTGSVESDFGRRTRRTGVFR